MKPPVVKQWANGVDLCECGAVVGTGIVTREHERVVGFISCPFCKGDKRAQLAKVGRGKVVPPLPSRPRPSRDRLLRLMERAEDDECDEDLADLCSEIEWLRSENAELREKP